MRLRERVFTRAEHLEAPVEIANFGAGALTNAVVSWRIENNIGREAAGAAFPAATLALGRTSVGNIDFDLSGLPAPGAYRLECWGQRRWPWQRVEIFGLYPAPTSNATPADILITRSWEAAAKKLAGGGSVLFCPPSADLDWSCPPLDAAPIFWNRQMNPGWSRMLGLWCDTRHPALAEFPTEANCDWQWTSILRRVRAINMERLPAGLQPIAQAIDDWNRNWKLGLLFEARVGSGRLVSERIRLDRCCGRARPVAAQLRATGS